MLEGRWPLATCAWAESPRGWDENRSLALRRLDRLFELRSQMNCLGVPKEHYTPWLNAEYNRAWREFVKGYQAQTASMDPKRLVGVSSYEAPWYAPNAYDKYVANLINALRQKGLVKGLPVAVPEQDGCGDGDINVTVKLLPANGRLSIIDSFAYRLCQARGLNAEDERNCPGWADVLSSRILMAGRYRYKAGWSDGGGKTGWLDVDHSTELISIRKD